MGDAHDRLAGLDTERLAQLSDLRSFTVSSAQLDTCPDSRIDAAHWRENGVCRCFHYCGNCGALSRGHWCSTACHRADEPGAYEPDDYGDDE